MTAITCGEIIPKLLEGYGVNTVFGIPGVHTVELYRGLPQSNIQHITPRHEQGAGFMADGYARASDKPGVCLIITGPGMTNITTAMGQALQSATPMLVISSVNQIQHLGMGEGRLHELPNQSALMQEVSVFSHTLLDVNNLPKILARAFSVFHSKRPGPVHIEIPLDVMTQDASHIDLSPWPLPFAPAPSVQAINAAVALLAKAKRPLLVIGGGARAASAPLLQLVEKLAMPVINTAHAKGIIPASHPLSIGGSPSHPASRAELQQHADLVLAIGTELAETDYDFFFLSDLAIQGKFIRIDIDADQTLRNVKPCLAIQSDARQAAEALVAALDQQPERSSEQKNHGQQRAETLRAALLQDRKPDYHQFFQAIKETLPDCIIAGDSTQPTYFATLYYETEKPYRYFHSVAGYGTLGYAIPAAIGAKLAMPDVPVICLTGDGGAQFSINELTSAVETDTAVIFLIWNNHGHGEIRRFMDEKNISRIGVDIQSPDYVSLAIAMGCKAVRSTNLDEFKQHLRIANQSKKPMLIELMQDDFVNGYGL